METYEPEMGQAAFGQPYSEFGCPSFIEAGLMLLAEEIERVERNISQKDYEAPTGNNGEEYLAESFEMRAYYWGECTCGAEMPQHVSSCDLETKWDAWAEHRMDYCSAEPEETDGEFDEFVMRPLDMSKFPEFEQKFPPPSCTCGASAAWTERDECDTTCKTVLPNFKCGDFEVRWYKYMGRGMSMNQAIDANAFFELIDRCIKSVREHEDRTLPDECKSF